MEINEIIKESLRIKPTLFETVEKILQYLRKERGESLTVYDQIVVLWDLVQAYPYEKTYKLTAAVEKGAFECHLRSFILGRLLRDNLHDKVVIFVDYTYRHTSLIVILSETLNTDRPVGYFVDPSKMRVNRWTPEDAVQPIQDQNFLGEIIAACRASPENFIISLKLDETQPYIDEYHCVADFSRIHAGFWNNIYDPSQGDLNMWFFCLRKSLENNPHYPEAWNNLGVLYATKEFSEYNLDRAFQYFQQVVKYNPNHLEAWNNLGVLYATKEFSGYDLDKASNSFQKAQEILNASRINVNE